MGKKSKCKCPDGVPEWVVTYGDLMSLLLCFFILLSAFSELKRPHDYQKVIESIKEAMGFRGGIGQADALIAANNTNNPVYRQAKDLNLDSDVEAVLNELNVTGRHAAVSKVHEGTKFALGGDLAFEAGRAELSETVKQTLLNEVAPKIRDVNYVVLVRGHAWGADDTQRSGLDHDDLSYERAKAVREFLVREAGVNPEILRVVSAGATEPRSVSLETPEAGRQNRRVEVYRTEVTVGEMHPDPHGTGRE